MVKIAYILLCHGNIEPIKRLITQILESDTNCAIVVHYDKRDSSDHYLELKASYSGSRCHFLSDADRVQGEWGTFGLVQAVLNAFDYIKESSLGCSHCYLISGSCYPLRPLYELNEYLGVNRGLNFIECQGSDWIRGGIKKDRYFYHHVLSKRKYPKLFRWIYLAQKRLGLKRIGATSMQVYFGSQWWCLTWESVSKIVEYAKSDKRFVKFFRTVWIPDECFFQTAVRQLCDPEKIADRSLTYYEFDKKGKPRYFAKNEIACDILRNYFFIRKYH